MVEIQENEELSLSFLLKWNTHALSPGDNLTLNSLLGDADYIHLGKYSQSRAEGEKASLSVIIVRWFPIKRRNRFWRGSVSLSQEA